jgi:hypothetical protein
MLIAQPVYLQPLLNVAGDRREHEEANILGICSGRVT